MGTTPRCNAAPTRVEKKRTTSISHLDHGQLPAQALGSTPTIASLSSHPLVSVAATAYVLALIYLPSHLLSLLLSPVSLTAVLLLVTLLHLGSCSPVGGQQREDIDDQQRGPSDPCLPRAVQRGGDALGSKLKPVAFSPERYHLSADWARRGPLEVIYEEYDEYGNEEGDDSPACSSRSPGRRLGLLEGTEYSLGTCSFTDDDSDDENSGTGSPAWCSRDDLCFRLEEEEEEGLIEIALDEDGLIEIDISTYR